MFGDFVKKTRISKRIGLRDFCLKCGLDPSNWSKVERGIAYPPKEPGRLEVLALALGLKPEDQEWSKLFELAEIARGRVPKDIMNDKELAKCLPPFFRTLRGERPEKEELEELAELIRRA